MVYLEAQYNHYDFGDVAQYYNQYGALTNFVAPSLTLRITESQEPNIYAGFHHEWDPGIHTLFLAARLNDTLTLSDPLLAQPSVAQEGAPTTRGARSAGNRSADAVATP